MPQVFNITAPDGKKYRLTAPDKATSDEIQSRVNSLVAQHQAPSGISGTIGEIGHGIYQGGIQALESIPAAGLAAWNAPGQIIQDIGALATSPRTAIPAQAKRAGQFALSMVPETLRRANPLLRAASVATGLGDPAPITPRGAAQDVTSFLLSQRLGEIIPRGLKKATRFAIREMPGASVELHSLAIPQARQLPETVRPTSAAKNAAYARLSTMGAPTLWLSRFRDTLVDLIDKERRLANPDQGFISTMENYLNDSAQGWSFDKVQDEAKRLGALYGQVTPNIGATATETPRGLARERNTQLGSLISALHEDVGAELPSVMLRPAGPATPTLNPVTGRWQIVSNPPVYGPGTATSLGIADQWHEASRLARRDFAANGLGKMIERGITTTGDQFESLGPNIPIREIRRAQRAAKLGDKKARLFVNSFEPGELDKIVNTLKSIGRHLPRIPPGQGVNVGSYARWKTAAIGGLTGAGIGEMAGSPAWGAAIGEMSGVVLHDMIAQAMMSEPGRAVVRAAMRIDPTVGPVFRNTLAGFLRSQIPPSATQSPQTPIPTTQPTPSPAPTPTPTLYGEALQQPIRFDKPPPAIAPQSGANQ